MAKKAYLQSSMRFRGYFSKGGTYAGRYKELRAAIVAEVDKGLRTAGVIKESKIGTVVIFSPDVADMFRRNYHVADDQNMEVDAGHEQVMGTGKVEESLGALPAVQPQRAAQAGNAASAPGPIRPALRTLVAQRRSTDTGCATGTDPKHAVQDDITITFGPNAVQSAVSGYSLEVLKDIMRAAGVRSAEITSTLRTAEDQARAMFANLEGKGVQHQRDLYKNSKGAQMVIDTYVASKKAGKKPTAIKADMEATIKKIGPISRHMLDPNKLNVIDVAPSSIGDAKANAAFKKAARAEEGKRVSRYIPPPADPAHHFEIVPK